MYSFDLFCYSLVFLCLFFKLGVLFLIYPDKTIKCYEFSSHYSFKWNMVCIFRDYIISMYILYFIFLESFNRAFILS